MPAPCNSNSSIALIHIQLHLHANPKMYTAPSQLSTPRVQNTISYVQWADEFGPVIRVEVLGPHTYMVTDAKLVQALLTQKGVVQPKDQFAYDFAIAEVWSFSFVLHKLFSCPIAHILRVPLLEWLIIIIGTLAKQGFSPLIEYPSFPCSS